MNSLKKCKLYWELEQTIYARQTDDEKHFKLDGKQFSGENARNKFKDKSGHQSCLRGP